jgi:hypothetical protein
MDNKGILSPVATMIMEDETTLYEFNETQVDGNARVLFYHPTDSTVTVIVHKFYGDRTGQVHLRTHQIVYVEYVESETNVTEAPVSYIIDYGAKLVMPTESHFQGTNTTLDGLLIGIHHLYVEDNCNLIVSSTAQTAQIENGEFVDITEGGNFELPTINVKMDGILEFTKITTDFIIGAAFLEMKYGSTVYMNHGFIVAGDVDMETSSKFSLEGKGHGAELGDGKGVGNNGGSYGGVGGGADDSSAYGSAFDPNHLGSGGGGTDGGPGGGFVNFTIGKSLHIDGYVDAYGADSSGIGGGGSGGSIFIKAYDMSGRGVLDVSGGDGSGTGCGGSGGRIAAHIDSENLFVGEYLSHGGYSGNNVAQCDGGPGTIYKFESARGPQYRELKYNPRLNETIVEPEHRKLTVENGDLITPNPAVVMESDSDYYEFEELQVEGNSYVHFYHPESAETVTVIIHELTGNKKGMIRVQSMQQVIINFVESTHIYLDAPCGFHVDPDGEIVLPSTVVMLTEKTILGGAMVGVEELFIERNAEFVMDKYASTVSLDSFKLGKIGSHNTGVVNIPTISVNNLGIFTVDMNPSHPIIKSGHFTVRNGGLLAANSFQITIETAYLDVEYGGSVDGSEQGYLLEEGPGAGSSSSHDASGGALASRG